MGPECLEEARLPPSKFPQSVAAVALLREAVFPEVAFREAPCQAPQTRSRHGAQVWLASRAPGEKRRWRQWRQGCQRRKAGRDRQMQPGCKTICQATDALEPGIAPGARSNRRLSCPSFTVPGRLSEPAQDSRTSARQRNAMPPRPSGKSLRLCAARRAQPLTFPAAQAKTGAWPIDLRSHGRHATTIRTFADHACVGRRSGNSLTGRFKPGRSTISWPLLRPLLNSEPSRIRCWAPM